jgi:hypothetical protein
MSKSTPKAFQYGVVIHRLTPYRGITLTQGFFCLDADTATVISTLAKTIVFPEWEVVKPDLWVSSKTEDLCISQTPDGWLVIRDSPEQTLTHEGFLLPILFPTAKMAQKAAELCYPTMHPALGWSVEDIDQTPADNPGPDPALGWIVRHQSF